MRTREFLVLDVVYPLLWMVRCMKGREIVKALQETPCLIFVLDWGCSVSRTALTTRDVLRHPPSEHALSLGTPELGHLQSLRVLNCGSRTVKSKMWILRSSTVYLSYFGDRTR